MFIALSESRIYRIREAQPKERLGIIDLNGLNSQSFALLFNIIGDSRRGKDAADLLARYPIFDSCKVFILYSLPDSDIISGWNMRFHLHRYRIS